MTIKPTSIKNLCLSVFICGQIFLLSCFNSNQSNQNTQSNEQTNFEVSTPNIDLAKPLEISSKSEDVALSKKVDEIIEKSEFANARWGIFAVSLKDGRVLFSKDGRKLFNPASAQKILTSVVALDKLGADFRWKTGVFTNNLASKGS